MKKDNKKKEYEKEEEEEDEEEILPDVGFMRILKMNRPEWLYMTGEFTEGNNLYVGYVACC